MAGRRISGIFVPIQLDTSNVQRDLEGLNKGLGTVIDSIQKKFEGALNTKDLANNVVRATRAMGNLRDSADALGRINGVNIFSDKMGELPSALRNISEAFGGTIKQQKELYAQLVKTQAIDQQVKALQTLQRMLRITAQEAVELAKSRGVKLSSEALSQVIPAVEIAPIEPSRFKKLADSLRTQFREAAQAAGVEGSAALERSFVKEGLLKQVYADIKKVAEGTGVAKSEMAAFFESIGKGGVWDKFNPIAQMKAQIEQLPKVLTGASESYKRYSELLYTSGFKGTPGTLGKYEQSLRDSAAINAAKELASATGMSAKELRAEAEAAGFTKEMIDKLIPSTKQLTEFSSQLGKSAAEYRRLATSAGAVPSQEGYQKFLDTANIRRSISAFEQLNVGQKLTSKNFAQIASAAKVSTQQVADYVQAVTRAEKKAGRGLAGIFTPSSISAGAQSALAATGVVTGMYGVTELAKSSYQASMRMENLQLAFESVFGSASKASAQLDFVRQVSDKLGLSFLATAEGAKKMFAAARGTEVEKDANQIFQAFSTMSAALKLTGDETNSVFLAISQMMSKGKISAEELRLQLSERMPGAVTLFAKSIGVTTKELDDMLQKGQVGLDSLRKFALEVERTYAAGAAGASKGLQAELNRVSNAWFDLKRAFVDAKGSAESLTLVTAGLKGLAATAPGIMAVTAAFLKFSVMTATAYGVVKAVTAIQTAFIAFKAASGLVEKGLEGLNQKFMAFARTPLGIAVALATVGATIWSLVSAQESGMESLDQYSASLTEMASKADEASKKMGGLNQEVLKTSIKYQTEKVSTSRSLFGKLTAPQPIQVEIMGEIVPVMYGKETESPFVKELEKLKKNGALWNRYVEAAQVLGNSFGEEFANAVNSGVSEEEQKKLLESYTVQFATLFENIRGTAPKEVSEGFNDIASKLLNLAKAWGGEDNVLRAMSKDAKDTTQHLLTFNKEFEAIQKMTKGTELGKELKYREEAEASVKSLLAMGKAVQTAHARMAELGSKTAENAKEWEKNEDIVKKNEQAFVLLGQAAVKNKMDLSILNEAIRVAGEAAKMSTGEIEALQKKLAEGFRIGGIKTGESLLKDLDTEIALSKATAGQKKAFSVLSPYIKDDASKLNVVTMLMKNDVKGLQVAFKDTSFIAENMTEVLAKAGELAGSVDAKKGASNWESINTTIQNTTKTLETWKAKLAEAKADEFSVSLKAELRKIDEAIASSKATSTQIAQLKTLRAQIEEVGEARKKQVADEERLKIREELTRTGSRVTRAFKGLVGIDNAEVYEAAKQQYTLDAEFFRKALEKKQISQEEFNTYMMMLQETLADSWLRSQTDMFSRLQVAANDYYKKYGDFTKHVGSVVTAAMDDSAKAIAAFARSGASDFNSLANAFSAMAERMLQTATDLFAQQAVSALWSGAMELFGGSLSKTVNIASGTISQGVSAVKHASGGAYFGGNLSSYSGSIVSSPTLFSTGTRVPAYASGAGLMGEAGPEGIFPLERDSSGKLGVRAKSGMGAALNQNINVNVINNTSSQVTTQETRDNQGNVSIDVMIEEHVGKAMRRPGSAPFKALQNNWGGTPALAQRG